MRVTEIPVIENAIDKIKQIGYDRCGSCPAFWAETDYWGESDAGCRLNRDIEEFCNISFFPKFAVNSMIKRADKKLDAFYTKCGEAMEIEEFEMECLQSALHKTLEANMLEICYEGEKRDLDYQFSRDLLKEFKKLTLREATPETTESAK